MPANPISSLKGQGRRADHIFIDAHHQLGIDVVRVELQHAHLVVLGLGRRRKPAPNAALDHGEIGAAQAARPAAGKEGVHVVGILAEAPIGLAIASSARAKMRSRASGPLGGVPAGQKAVVGVEGRVEQIEPVEFLKNHRIEQQGRCLRVARMLRVELLEPLHSAGEVEIVEAIGGFAYERVVVQRVGVNRRGPGVWEHQHK